jgi:hypothetical protein
MEHTQMHLALKKATIKINYTNNSCVIFVNSLCQETKIPTVDMNV